MPIHIVPFQADDLCFGHKWEIQDRNLLITLVAKVLVGKYRHAQQILHSIAPTPSMNRNEPIIKAIEILTLPSGSDPWHRDGLIFQIFSWIAANIAANKNAIIRAPHIIPAQKGFDGLQVNVNLTTKSVDDILIFEDKATTSPRKTINEKVWPEFSEFYTGKRDHEIEHEITMLIQSRPDLITDMDQSIENIYWNKVRKFRVAITADAGHDSPAGQKRLFRDYDIIIPTDDINYRQAEYIHIADLREWMEFFSQDTIILLKSWLISDV